MHARSFPSLALLVATIGSSCGGSGDGGTGGGSSATTTATDATTTSSGGGAGGAGGASGTGGDGDAGGAPTLPAGVVNALPDACTVTSGLVGATCETLQVAGCTDLEDATVQILIADPTGGPFRGTVVFGSGSAGASPMEKAGGPAFVAELETLRSEGFRVVQRAWQGAAKGDRGWLRGTKGPYVSACRYATLLGYLADRFESGGAFCAVGFSGGSMELGMAMARWGLDARLDHAVFESGPTASFADACIAREPFATTCAEIQAEEPWDCAPDVPACLLGDNIACLIDESYGADPMGGAECDPDVQVCAARDEAHADQLLADSVLAPGVDRSFPGTKLGALFGMQDCGSGAALHGLDFVSHITGKDGAAPTVVLEPTSGHTVHATGEGALALRQLVEGGCSE
jgi:hypothetical protein